MGCGAVVKQPRQSQTARQHNTNDSAKARQNLNESDNIHVIQVSNVALAIKKGDQHVINVEIALGIRNLPTPKTFEEVRAMIVLFKEVPDLLQIGRTEAIKNEQNPKFLTTFLVPTTNSNDQKIYLHIYNQIDPESEDLKHQKLIGTSTLDLQNFVESDSNELEVQLMDTSAKERTAIHVNCSEYNGGGTNYEVELTAIGFSNIKCEMFLVIEVLKDNDWIPVAKTEAVIVKNDTAFKVLNISSHKFPGEDTSRIRFRCYQNSQEREEIGFCEDILLGSLMNSDDKDKEKENSAKRIEKGGEFQGKIKVNSWKKINQDSFLTYIVNGARLHLILGIDYTNSTLPLHSQSDDKNLYVLAIKEIVGMLQYFDYYNQIALYGFGAKLPPYYKTVGQCFALNGNYFQPLVTGGVEKIIKLYRQNLCKVKPHGPSKLSEIINMAIQFARSAENQSTNYYVLIILTDGAIDDFNDTVNKIIYASSLPLSIVLVGLGDGDFTLLKKLDQDNQLLVSDEVTKEEEKEPHSKPIKQPNVKDSKQGNNNNKQPKQASKEYKQSNSKPNKSDNNQGNLKEEKQQGNTNQPKQSSNNKQKKQQPNLKQGKQQVKWKQDGKQQLDWKEEGKKGQWKEEGKKGQWKEEMKKGQWKEEGKDEEKEGKQEGKKNQKVCIRDMIDFIDFKQYQIDEKQRNFLTEINLAKKIFAELPKQFVNYMKAQHIRPNKEKKGIKAAKGEFLAEKISTSKKKEHQLIIPEVQFLKEEKKKFIKNMLSLGLQPGKTFDQTLVISMKDELYFLQIYASKLPPPVKEERVYTENISFRQQKKFEEQLQEKEKTSNHQIQREIFKRKANQMGKRQRLLERIAEAPQKKQLRLKHPCLKCQQREICIIYGECGHLAVCEQCQEHICIVCHELNSFFYNINDYQL